VLPILDEAYFEYMAGHGHDGAQVFTTGRPIVVTRTFSKIFGLAGLRVGYMFAPTELIAAVGKVRNVFDVNSVAKVAATASLEEAANHLPERVAQNLEERRRVGERLAEFGTPALPSDGNFVFVDLADAKRAIGMFDALMARGIIIRPARGFGAPTGVRITIGHPSENDRFLDEYAEALALLPDAA
jgi:histidinol-phosphate aminotransferase